MRNLVYFTLVAICAACKGDVSTPMTDHSKIEPLFAAGSTEQQLVDKFLARYPVEKAAQFRATLAERGSVLSAVDPEAQRELTAIYEAIDRQAASTRPTITPHKPGPREAALIAKFLQMVPPESVAKLRFALLSSSAEVHSNIPEERALLREIYDMRETEGRGQNQGEQ